MILYRSTRVHIPYRNPLSIVYVKYADIIPSLFIELISKFLRYVELGE
jgi:hypothetical protein